MLSQSDKLLENETIIRWDETGEFAKLWTANGKVAREWKSFGFPVLTWATGGWYVEVPADRITYKPIQKASPARNPGKPSKIAKDSEAKSQDSLDRESR